MALPTTVYSSVQFKGASPPFKSSAGNFYVLAHDTTTEDVLAMKATDPTDSWAEQDSADRPTLTGLSQYDRISVRQNGDNLHIAGHSGASGIYYHEFNMATDQWVTGAKVGNIDNFSVSGGAESVDLAIRSDDDIIIVYSGLQESVHNKDYGRLDYARWEGSSWNVGNAIDAGGTTSYVAVACALSKAGNDDIHIGWMYASNRIDQGDITCTNAEARTLRSDNTLSSTVGGGPTLGHTGHNNLIGMVTWTDAGTERIGYMLVTNTSDAVLDMLTSTEDAGNDVQAWGATPVVISSPETLYVNTSDQHWTAHGIDNNNTLYTMFIDASTRDAWWSKSNNPGATTWDSPLEASDAIMGFSIACNIYTRSGKTLAYVYDDNGTLKYDEVALPAEGTPPFLIAQKKRVGVRYF